MALYRKARPDEIAATIARVSTVSVSTKPRSADRHKDPKAHSAKTAARARAKRAAKP